MSEISFIVKSREASQGSGRISIGLPNSSRDMLSENELLKILNTLKNSHLLDEKSSAGFEYILDFELTGRDTFPYALEMILG